LKLFKKSIQLSEISPPLRDTMCFIYYNGTDIFWEILVCQNLTKHVVLKTHLWEVKISWNISSRRSWEPYIILIPFVCIPGAMLNSMCHCLLQLSWSASFQIAWPAEMISVTPNQNQDILYLICLQNLEWRHNDDFLAFIKQ
jgi:hypothetical protein